MHMVFAGRSAEFSLFRESDTAQPYGANSDVEVLTRSLCVRKALVSEVVSCAYNDDIPSVVYDSK